MSTPNAVNVTRLSAMPLDDLDIAKMDANSAQLYAARTVNELAASDPDKLARLLDFIERIRHTEFSDAATTFIADLIEREAKENEVAAIGFVQKFAEWVKSKVPFAGRWLMKLVPVERLAREGYRDATEMVAQFLRDWSQPEKKGN